MSKELVERLRSGVHSKGCAQEGTTPGLSCNCIRGEAAEVIEDLDNDVDQLIALVQELTALVKRLCPGNENSEDIIRLQAMISLIRLAKKLVPKEETHWHKMAEKTLNV